MKTYEFKIEDENRELMEEILGELFENRANFSVAQIGRHYVLRVDEFEGFKNWFDIYFDNCYDTLETYEVWK